ncbi:band 7 protein AGAP004871-like [Centropristis striata]|uniref:band 7 protein AGAP004871-like n=1 Tax=Centropristis striata TaxID=184440 RepID=UPI0027E16DD6|nr:band 7 protein AGAP004871-like [Centropristis striata]
MATRDCTGRTSTEAPRVSQQQLLLFLLSQNSFISKNGSSCSQPERRDPGAIDRRPDVELMFYASSLRQHTDGSRQREINTWRCECRVLYINTTSLSVLRADGGRRRVGVLEVFGAVLTLLSAAFILFTFPFSAWMCAKVVQEYERAVIFRLGRVVKGRAKGPGLFWFIPWLDVIQTVDLRTVSFNVQPQEVLTADGVPLKVDAVVFYRVVDPALWVTRVENGYQATHTLAQTTLRATLGAHTLTDILTQRGSITKRTEEVLYAASRLWGVLVERVELKDLTLPVSLQRCMASEAEAARQARAKMIVAEGEVKASQALMVAASGLPPVAFHLRYLQSLSSVSSSASVVVFGLPTELLDVFMSHQP